MEDLVGSSNPTSSPVACLLPQDPRAAKMWPGPSLPLPLLAAPPKGAATNICATRRPQDLGRRLQGGPGDASIRSQGLSTWGTELLSCTSKRLALKALKLLV